MPLTLILKIISSFYILAGISFILAVLIINSLTILGSVYLPHFILTIIYFFSYLIVMPNNILNIVLKTSSESFFPQIPFHSFWLPLLSIVLGAIGIWAANLIKKGLIKGHRIWQAFFYFALVLTIWDLFFILNNESFIYAVGVRNDYSGIVPTLKNLIWIIVYFALLILNRRLITVKISKNV